MAGFRVLRRLVADAKLDGVEAAGHSELVQRHLHGEHAGRLARGAHPERDRHVQRREAVRGAPVGRGVHHPAAHRRLLGELLVASRLLDHLVGQGAQAAIAVRPQTDPLDGRRAVADEGEHLLSGERQLHRPPGDRLGCQCHRRHVGVGPALGAEAATDVGRDDPHALRRQTDQGGDGRACRVHALGRVVQRQRVVRPDGDGRMRLHRVVVLHGRAVDLIDLDLRRRQRLLDVTLLRVRRVVRIDPIGRVEVAAIGAKLDVVSFLRVVHPHERSAMPRHLERLCDHRADDLAAKGDRVGLQHPECLVLVGRQPRRVLVCDDRDHARECLGRGGVDPGDAAACDRRLHEPEIERIADRVLEGIGGRAHDLGGAVPPLQRPPHRGGFQQLAHQLVTPVSPRSTPIRVLRASGILKALPRLRLGVRQLGIRGAVEVVERGGGAAQDLFGALRPPGLVGDPAERDSQVLDRALAGRRSPRRRTPGRRRRTLGRAPCGRGERLASGRSGRSTARIRSPCSSTVSRSGVSPGRR